ncbi:beta-1,3-galactosyltransferase 2-like [Alosa pseudoharengus]|uniref:beta-1,3-galactosyltransferase 2-like n=1 Tax=Alosa pseudoharengus TaxID=34774 RepID=UPI003F8A669D
MQCDDSEDTVTVWGHGSQERVYRAGVQELEYTPHSSTQRRLQDHDAYPRQYHFLINEPDVCQRQQPFLVLMVPVHPGNERARQAIRSTWGNETVVQGKVVTTLFLLGSLNSDVATPMAKEMVYSESARHHDILQSDFLDTYLNLTIKTMVIMDWLATYCPGAAYAMKIDSDMFLNMENLMSLLLMPQTPKQNYITGYLMWNRPVVRDHRSKWYVSEELYPKPNYPTYLLGMGYLFSNDLPEKLVRVSKDIKPFNIEDAYVGVCLTRLGIEASVPPDPSQFKAYTSGPFKRCDYVKVITTILGSANQLLEYWAGYKKGGPPC